MKDPRIFWVNYFLLWLFHFSDGIHKLMILSKVGQTSIFKGDKIQPFFKCIWNLSLWLQEDKDKKSGIGVRTWISEGDWRSWASPARFDMRIINSATFLWPYVLKAKKFAEPLFQSKKITEQVRESGRNFRAIWGNFGPFWVILGHFWATLDHFGWF